MSIHVQAVEYHRNGVAGEPFYACRFEEDGREFIATVFHAIMEGIGARA